MLESNAFIAMKPRVLTKNYLINVLTISFLFVNLIANTRRIKLSSNFTIKKTQQRHKLIDTQAVTHNKGQLNLHLLILLSIFIFFQRESLIFTHSWFMKLKSPCIKQKQK